jgi:hypothetical protein
MKRLISICMLSSLIMALAACGSSSENGDKLVSEYLPASNELTGWEEDASKGEAGPEMTTEIATATIWVNGAMDRFVQAGGWQALGREYYKNGDNEVALYIYEMDAAASAVAAYDAMEDYAGVPWSDFSFGGGESNGRFGCVATFYCYSNATKGKYFLESTVEPIEGETDAKAFFTAVLNKLP